MADFKEMTGLEIQASFEAFHQANPHVYRLIKKQIIRAIKKGKTKISIRHIASYLVWEMYIETTDENHDFKLNNNYTSRYSRLFAEEFPKHAGLFNYRSLRTV
jgi:hypothetical protein